MDKRIGIRIVIELGILLQTLKFDLLYITKCTENFLGQLERQLDQFKLYRADTQKRTSHTLSMKNCDIKKS